MRIGQAVLLGLFLTYFEDDTSVSKQRAYIYGGCLCFVYVLAAILDHVASHHSLYSGIKIRVAVTSLIYRKVSPNSYLDKGLRQGLKGPHKKG